MGSKVHGVTTDGKQLYKLVTKRSRSKPRLDPVTNEQLYRKNQMTGENMYPLREPEWYDKTEIFYLESEGNANVRKIIYVAPTAEELAAVEREKKIENWQREMAEAAVDAGMSVDDVIEGRKPEQVAGIIVPYPVMTSPGKWKLSNGTEMKGKKVDALEAEEAIATAKENAATTPEY